MKLRYFLTSIIACLALAIGCTQEELPALSEIQVTPSYFTFGVDGGSKTVTVTAVDAWEVTDVPEWLNVSPAKGEATGAEGVKVTITAAPTTAEKVVTATIKFNCAGKAQLVTVGQEAFVPDFPKFEAGEYWIMFGEEAAVPVSGTYGYLYTAKASVSEDGKLSSTAGNIFKFAAVEGGFTIQDANGMYYYMKGTYDSFNVDASPVDGSVWTVQQVGEKEFKIVNAFNAKVMQYDPNYSSAGAYSNERGTYPNLVSVAGGEIAEVMFAVEPTEVELEKEAGDFNINMTCRNEGFEIKPSASWITLKGMTSTEGEYVVTFSYEANEGGARSATIDFISGEETITVEVAQAGAVLNATVAEFLAAEEGATLYRVQGVVKSLSVSSQFHNANITITGGAGEELYLYRVVAAEGNIEDVTDLKEGSLITVVGARSSYNNAPQMASGGILEEVVNYEVKTVAEFLAAEEGDAVYAVTGEIVGIKDLSESYNNVGITIKDGDSEVLLYRVKTFDGTNVTKLNLEVGGTVTVAGKRSSYNGSPQMAAGGLLLNYVAPAEGGEEGGDDNTGTTPGGDGETYTMIDKVANLAAGTYYMAGYLTSYENNGTAYDWSSYPYHVCNGVSTDLYTSTYSFADGVLTKNPDESYEATDVVLEAVEGKTATFYVKIKDGYLYSSEYSNRKLGISETKVEWVATDNEKGGITLTTTMAEGTISVGTAGATSKMIRSYKDENTLKYGLVFFKKN